MRKLRVLFALPRRPKLNMEIEIVKGDITKLKVEAIANPANSNMTMGGGLSGVILKAGGEEIEKEAQKLAPVKVGEAIVTGAGRLPAKYVIHAPTMEKPSMKVGKENVNLAMRAILKCADENGISEIAAPGLATGVGGVSYLDAAEAMVDEIKKFKGKDPQKVILVAYNDELYEAFKIVVSK